MIDSISASLAEYSLLEWVGLITGIIYVILSSQNQITCWVFGIISCACIAYHDFFGGAKLYSDGILQIFYIAMGAFGIYQWRSRKVNSDIDILESKTLREHIIIIALASVLSLVYGFLMSRYTDAAFPMLDAFTTVFSIAATVLLVYRMLSAWLYFVVINVVMVYLYSSRGWDLYALLYLIFTLVAFYAIWNWRRISKPNTESI